MKLDLVACHIDSYGVENWYDKPRNNHRGTCSHVANTY